MNKNKNNKPAQPRRTNNENPSQPPVVQVVTHWGVIYEAAVQCRVRETLLIRYFPVTDFGFSRAFQKHYQESNPFCCCCFPRHRLARSIIRTVSPQPPFFVCF